MSDFYFTNGDTPCITITGLESIIQPGVVVEAKLTTLEYRSLFDWQPVEDGSFGNDWGVGTVVIYFLDTVTSNLRSQDVYLFIRVSDNNKVTSWKAEQILKIFNVG